MKNQGNTIQTKEQDKTPEINPNEMNIYELSGRVFKIAIIKMLKKLRKTMHEQKQNFNKKKYYFRRTK